MILVKKVLVRHCDYLPVVYNTWTPWQHSYVFFRRGWTVRASDAVTAYVVGNAFAIDYYLKSNAAFSYQYPGTRLILTSTFVGQSHGHGRHGVPSEEGVNVELPSCVFPVVPEEEPGYRTGQCPAPGLVVELITAALWIKLL